MFFTGSAVDIFIPFITTWIAVKSQRRLVQKHIRMIFEGDSNGKDFLNRYDCKGSVESNNRSLNSQFVHE